MLGHAAHWATSLLYFAPVVALVVFLVVQSGRERRRGRKAEPEGDRSRDAPCG